MLNLFANIFFEIFMKNTLTKIKNLAELIKANGGRAMLVGGCVRDELMELEPKDFDIEVYGLEPPQLKEILSRFGRVDTVGESFTVYKIGQDLDVSLPRRERKVARGHKGFVIEGDARMSFEEAARRRDFTINAIMKDVLTGEIVDCYGGQADIKRKKNSSYLGRNFCRGFFARAAGCPVCRPL